MCKTTAPRGGALLTYILGCCPWEVSFCTSRSAAGFTNGNESFYARGQLSYAALDDVAKLSAHEGTLLSTARCEATACQASAFAVTVCGIDEAE